MLEIDAADDQFRKKTKSAKRNPVERASLLSRCTFFFRLVDLFRFGHDNNNSSTTDVRPQDSSAALHKSFAQLWTKEITNGNGNLWHVIKSLYGRKLLVYGLIYSLIDSVCRCVTLVSQYKSQLISNIHHFTTAAADDSKQVLLMSDKHTHTHTQFEWQLMEVIECTADVLSCCCGDKKKLQKTTEI